jgi:hypothetical protein
LYWQIKAFNAADSTSLKLIKAIQGFNSCRLKTPWILALFILKFLPRIFRDYLVSPYKIGGEAKLQKKW